MHPSSRGLSEWVLSVALVLELSGCAGVPGILPDAGRAEPRAVETVSSPPDPASAPRQGLAADHLTTGLPPAIRPGSGEPGPGALQAAATQRADDEIEEYDPWEPFNEKMFEFNRWLDRWIVKPAAKGYNAVMPDRVQQMIDNGFDNIRVVPRFVNSLLQGKLAGAGRELARFLINSTLGIGGLFDVAKQEFNLSKSKEDAGQTLGVWGFTPGPYLVLPLLPPLTVRDGIGFAVDSMLDPLSYVLPFFWDRAGMKVGDTINDRSVNLDLYQGFEEATVEFYSALRNAYLQRRQRLIQE